MNVQKLFSVLAITALGAIGPLLSTEDTTPSATRAPNVLEHERTEYDAPSPPAQWAREIVVTAGRVQVLRAPSVWTCDAPRDLEIGHGTVRECRYVSR